MSGKPFFLCFTIQRFVRHFHSKPRTLRKQRPSLDEKNNIRLIAKMNENEMDEDEDNKIRSEVKVTFSEKQIVGNEFICSEFKTTLPSTMIKSSQTISLPKQDEDGDFELERETTREENVQTFKIMHTIESENLNEVGNQIWRGCLLMCDFILSDYFVKSAMKMNDGKNNCIFMELGCGVGLFSIFFAKLFSNTTTKRIIASDFDEQLLKLVEKNIDLNLNQIEKSKVNVVQLDWLKFSKETTKLQQLIFPNNNSNSFPFCFFVCDCVYDFELTDALLETLEILMKKSKSAANNDPICFLSVEKRINFCWNEKQKKWGQFALEFEYFEEKIMSSKSVFQLKKLDWKSFVGHSFWRHYQRVDELELIEIKLK